MQRENPTFFCASISEPHHEKNSWYAAAAPGIFPIKLSSHGTWHMTPNTFMDEWIPWTAEVGGLILATHNQQCVRKCLTWVLFALLNAVELFAKADLAHDIEAQKHAPGGGIDCLTLVDLTDQVVNFGADNRLITAQC